MLALVGILAGLLLGRLSGGRFTGLSHVKLRFEWVLLAAFIAQAVLRGRLANTVTSGMGLLVWASASLVLIGVLWLQHEIPGLLIAAVGVAMNLLVVLLNQGMPVSLPLGEVATRVGGASAGFYHLAGPNTYARVLGDALPLYLGGSVYILSIGDVLLCLGVIVLIVNSMLGDAQSTSGRTTPGPSRIRRGPIDDVA